MIILVGLIGTVFSVVSGQLKAFEADVGLKIGGYAVVLVLALFGEQLIMRPKGGFRENSTSILARLVFGAFIGVWYGTKQVNRYLFIGVLLAIAALVIQGLKFEERRKKKEAEVF